jgi:hypothetical protein
MSRYEDTLTERVARILGDGWQVECRKGWDALYARHENGSQTRVGLYGVDKRRSATEQDATDAVARLRRFLYGEISKYTQEWANKGRAALETMPEPGELVSAQNRNA